MFLVVYIPVMKWFPKKFSERLTVLRRTVVVLTALFSGLCFLEPTLNAIALMLFSVPAALVINYEGKHSGIPDIENFPRRILTLWFTSFGFWFADRLLCDVWLWLGTLQQSDIFRTNPDHCSLFRIFHYGRKTADHQCIQEKGHEDT
ncbi:hypothetical protein TELCIR_04760 [Teladorsagia circumcincta]|uniref:Alkaline ceramidase n=1 Tax=Teladorsagia circumcincta TaxID=45464 RepID=A0A2G9USR0_TELCI|nr:hypothetical protein TELCIR_04760 [Teladorsagia circumcincta]